jgi:thiosulfate reductase cytochrome b subunit
MTASVRRERSVTFTVIHPLVVRVTHWVNVVAMTCMVLSGWQIYDASPLFPFVFPPWMTLGGWLGGGIAWHLAAMWLLVANALVYFAYGVFGRHFMRSFVPLTPALVWRDLKEVLSFRLKHELGAYNAVQRLAYVVVLVLGVVAVWSGLALWKPVQLEPLARALGGYPVARRVHFFAMAGIVAFVALHLALVAIVPRTLVAMITGRARVAAPRAEVEP